MKNPHHDKPDQIAQSLDLCGLQCPMPLLKTKLALNQLAAGDCLAVWASDRGSMRDIPAFIAQTSHQLLSSLEQDKKFYFLIRKAG